MRSYKKIIEYIYWNKEIDLLLRYLNIGKKINKKYNSFYGEIPKN
jgi:hypothetical protein